MHKNEKKGRWRRLWRANKLRLKRRILLAVPRLYATNRIKYERSLTQDGEIEALLAQLDAVLAVPGDIVECGSFLCGTTVSMAQHLRRRRCAKRIYACDTFAGFDGQELARERQRGDAATPDDFTETDFTYVQRKLERLNVSDRITLVRGRFQETLAELTGPFAFAFIDCDLHDSMLYAAQTVWPRLSPNGICLFDDYGNDTYRGATRAIERFLDDQRSSLSDHGPVSRKFYFARKRHLDAVS